LTVASIIFFSVFVLPLVVFFIWLMRQDKRKGTAGLVVLAILVTAAIVYTYLTANQAMKQPVERSGEVHPK
jgi:4-amino-4-deoxy-L-arabinose transferase-like glycosyltransferase